MKIVVFGEIIWDVYGEGQKFIGGAPFNFAAHASLFGNDVTMYSAIGADALGREAEEYVDKFGISKEYVTKNGFGTGACLVLLDERGIPSYNLLNDVAYDHIPVTGRIPSGDILYFGTLAIRNPDSRKALDNLLKNGQYGDIFCDINIRKPFVSEEVVKLCFENATTIKISREELDTVLDFIMPNRGKMTIKQTAEKIAEAYGNIRTIIITLDSEGAVAYDRASGEYVEVPVVKTEVVSTVGAGDGFSAAFVSEYAKTKNLRFAIEFANRFAAYVVSKKEAIPTHAEFK